MALHYSHVLRGLAHFKHLSDAYVIDMPVKSKLRFVYQVSKHIQNSFAKMDYKKTATSQDILLNSLYAANPDLMHQVQMIKVLQMKAGQFWQFVAGQLDGWDDLKVGHASGLDLVNHTQKIAIELKNAHNTDNAASRTRNIQKLLDFKSKHNDYRVVYAVVNDHKPQHKKLYWKGQYVEYVSSDKLFQLLFGDQYQSCVTLIQNIFITALLEVRL